MLKKKLVEVYRGFKIYKVSEKGWVSNWVVADSNNHVVMEGFNCRDWSLRLMKKYIRERR